MVGLMANAEMLSMKKDRKCWSTDSHHLPKLYTLIIRMTIYLKHAIVSANVCVCVCVCVGL